MSRHRRRRPRKNAEAQTIPVTDSDLVALWNRYAEPGRKILASLQRGRDENRREPGRVRRPLA